MRGTQRAAWCWGKGMTFLIGTDLGLFTDSAICLILNNLLAFLGSCFLTSKMGNIRSIYKASM